MPASRRARATTAIPLPSERSRPGRGSASTRRGNPPHSPSAPASRAAGAARGSARCTGSGCAPGCRGWSGGPEHGAGHRRANGRGGRLRANTPRPTRARPGGRSSPCGWRTWGRSSDRLRRSRGPGPPDTGHPFTLRRGLEEDPRGRPPAQGLRRTVAVESGVSRFIPSTRLWRSIGLNEAVGEAQREPNASSNSESIAAQERRSAVAL